MTQPHNPDGFLCRRHRVDDCFCSGPPHYKTPPQPTAPPGGPPPAPEGCLTALAQALTGRRRG